MRNAKNSNLRVVVDTNIIISALVFGGIPQRVMNTVLECGTLIVSPEILTKAHRIIRTKFPDFISDLKRFEVLAKRDGQKVFLGSHDIVVSRDPDDDMVIETALIGNCQYIVSGDKDLLVLGRYKDIRIITPTEFMKQFSS